MRNKTIRNEVCLQNSVKLKRFEVLVKVEYLNDNLFSDTAKFNNIKELRMRLGWMIY